MNKHYKAKPEELDALDRVILIENAMNALVDAAYAYARTITAVGSRRAVENALDGVAENGSPFVLPHDMPAYEVRLYSKAEPVAELVKATRDLAYFRRRAGQLVDA